MRIRYFVTNKRDTSPNNFLWHGAPHPLRIQDVKAKLTQLGVIDDQSHLRFLDKIKGEKIWLDIINNEVECPTNSEGVVDIKIVQQFYEASQTFMNDVFKGIPEDDYEEAVLRLRKVLFGGIKKKEGREPNQGKRDMEAGYVQFNDVEDFPEDEELKDKLNDLDLVDDQGKINLLRV